MKKEEGFSAVEALIATAITLVLLAGTLGSFNRSLGMNEKANQAADVEQNMRAAMNLLVSDYISAGWSIPIGGIPIPSGSGSVPVHRPGPPGTVYYFNSSTIASVNAGPAMGPYWNDRPTDMVNILYADNLLPLNERYLDDVGDDGVTVTVNDATPITGVNNPIAEGDLIALSNANGTTLQYVTNVTGQIIWFGPSECMLNQPAAAEGSIAQLENEMGGGFPPTTATRIWMVTYYLDYTTTPDSPRLIRRINYKDGEPVAMVLEDLQLSYDIVDGTTNPTNIKIPVAPNDPSQIRKAIILLSGRASTADRDSDEFLRRNLTTQVSLRSLSYFDRY